MASFILLALYSYSSSCVSSSREVVATAVAVAILILSNRRALPHFILMILVSYRDSCGLLGLDLRITGDPVEHEKIPQLPGVKSITLGG